MTSFNPSTDLLDLKGKVALVSGGSSGIGLETVRFLAQVGALVYMGARNESRATGAIAELEHDGLQPGNGEIRYFDLDLNNPRDVKVAGEAFLEREKRLDLLIHNAGIVSTNTKPGRDGVVENVTVNYIGPFLLTQILLPLLKKTAREPSSDVRVIYVSSACHVNYCMLL
ncbi:hypothetical protein CPB83DRAFT_855733 [Crepidotus variabilis]|uniref:Short-chain dehydrogenase n=1 Tax=Crepidotus variabilis TaxID=179855 RepID=A0A9P6EEU7_9AGAR|nr:hypothetical protein CPB83DRAFT_855733 [Crepidotus variabilis]